MTYETRIPEITNTISIDLAKINGNWETLQTDSYHCGEDTNDEDGIYEISFNPPLRNYSKGLVAFFKANTSNTDDGATLNINNLGAINIKKNGNEILVAGDIFAGQMVGVIFDGTNFQLMNFAVKKLTGCSVYISEAQTIEDETIDTILFDTKYYDTDNEYDTKTGRYTVGKGGLYIVSLNVAFVAASVDVSLVEGRIAVNGSLVAKNCMEQMSTKDVFLNVIKTIRLKKNDYIEGQAFHKTGQEKDLIAGINRTFMGIQQIG